MDSADLQRRSDPYVSGSGAWISLSGCVEFDTNNGTAVRRTELLSESAVIATVVSASDELLGEAPTDEAIVSSLTALQ